MKCYICGNEIKMNDDVLKISYGQFKGNYNYAEQILNSTHSVYICKDCAFENNLMSE